MKSPGQVPNSPAARSFGLIGALLMAGVIALFDPATARAQTATIGGTVTGGGAPVQGASVVATAYAVGSADGSRYEAVTDGNGWYQLDIAVPGEAVFVTVDFTGPGENAGSSGEDEHLALEAGEERNLDWVLSGGVDEKGTGEEDGAPGAAATEEDAAGGGSSSAPILLAYLPFDDAPPSEAARGLETEVLGSPETIDGRYGSGILFTGDEVVFLPLDIDFTTHRQLTVSAWLRLDPRRDQSSGYLLGGGTSGAATPKLGFRHKKILGGPSGEKIHYDAGDLPVGEWVHVAGVWDYDAHTLRLNVGGVTDVWEDLDMDPARLTADENNQLRLEHPTDPEREPRRYVTLGALNFDGYRSLAWVGVDDLRIYSGAMSAEQIAAIRESEGGPADPSEYAIAPPPPRPEEEQVTEDEGPGDRGELTGWELSEDYELSGVSGSTGEGTTRAEFSGPESENAYVTSAEVWEKSNRPCMVVLDAQVRGERAPTVHDDSRCDALDSSRQLSVDPGGGRNAVTGLQVCQNRRNDRVKGLRLRTDRWELGDDSIAFREQHVAEDEAPNCNGNWQGAVSCSAGSVATGAVAHWDVKDSGGGINVSIPKAELVGLQLVCRDVVGVYR